MEDDELVGSTVVEPFIKACSFPNGIEMESDGIAAGNDCAGDDVVSIEKRTGYRLPNTVNVDRRGPNESKDKAGSGGKKGGDHQHTEPAHIEAVVGGGYPLAEVFPGVILGT